MKKNICTAHRFYPKTRTLWLALATLGATASVSVMAVPVLPVVVFDNLLTPEETKPVAPPTFDDLTDELLPAPAIDAAAVDKRLSDIKNLYQNSTPTATNDETAPTFAIFNQLDGKTDSQTPIARLRATTPPVGLDLVGFVPKKDLPAPNADETTSDTATNNTPTTAPTITPTPNASTYQPIDPDEYLPAYKASELPQAVAPDAVQVVKKPPSVLKKAYHKVFGSGTWVDKLNAKIYLAIPNETAQSEAVNLVDDNKQTDDLTIFGDNWQFENDRLASINIYNQNVQLKPVDTAIEPFKNIANALANIDEESVADFANARSRLQETIVNASRAVGYYDVAFDIKQQQNGDLSVIVYNVGDPVAVSSQVVDIRGAGANLPSFATIKQDAKPVVGQPLHHGNYEATKTTIDQNSLEHGFFDGRWLNNSVDVVLPDNTADISLVYDTGEQYVFDEVVFFTMDPKTGQLTTDPDKLPVNLPLLQKMVGFKPNQPFVRSQVTKLSNELNATRYFNASNVETVLPNAQGAGLDFVQGAGTQNEPNEAHNAPTASTVANQSSDELPILTPMGNDTNTDNADNADNANTVIMDDNGQPIATISPIDFSPSQAIVEKVGLVKAKAERLLNSPDDRVLDENDKQATSLLGQVSDVIQKIAKQILPDESKDAKPTLADGEAPPILANKKSAEQVFFDKKVPLYVFVVADKPKDAQIGVGWGSDSGARLTGKYENNLMNKKGFQSGVEVGVARHQKSVNAYISRPLTHPVNDKSTASIKFEQNDIRQSVAGFDVQTNTVETALARMRIKENSWHRNYYLRYRLDDLKTNAPTAILQDLPVRFLESGTKQQALLAGYSMSKSVQNSLTAPTQGYRQSYAVEMGGQGVGSDANMVFLRAGLGGVYSFGNNQWGEKRANQLVGRVDLGYLWTDDFDKVPYSLRYFAGGDQSVRGYSTQSLSPVSTNGYLTGGQALAVGAVEYNREIKEGLRVAAFADVGSAYDKNFSNDTKFSLGLGVRYASPVGTVRVDIAKGVADKEQKTPVRLHFLIGLPF